MNILLRAVGFFLISSAATCFPMLLSRLLWAPNSSAGAEYIFWIASGINVAGLLILGARYFPCILFNGFAAHFLVHVPMTVALFGSAANSLEALIAVGILRKIGGYDGHFDRTRAAGALLLAALIGPLPGALGGAAMMIQEGLFPAAQYWTVASGWLFGNGGAILLLTPIVLSLWQRQWPDRPLPELVVWAMGALFLGVMTFDTVLRGTDTNFVFLLYPLVIFAGVRLGPAGTAAILFLVLLSVYLSLGIDANTLPLLEIPRKVWFVQAFSWVLAATGLMIAALVAERRQADERASTEEERRLEATWREERARLEALRYQINPHFLFNALNSIRSELPISQSIPREMITELADYLRSTLERPASDLLPLCQEIDSTRHYLGIEQKRFADRLRVAIDLDEDAAQCLVPVFLLQPLVENAIRHGLESSKAPCELLIRAVREPAALYISVSNTGSWKSENPQPGVGLENIRRRLALLYGNSAGLRSETTDGWVHVQIQIPLAS